VPRNWPALAIGLIIAIYWQRVAVMVARTRKLTGHSANVIPPEKAGRFAHVIWMPVIGLWLTLPFIAFAARSSKRFPKWLRGTLKVWDMPMSVRWAAVAIAIVALVATFICWKRMGKSWRMGIDPNDRTQLISSGPYAYVRHPIYGLSTILMLMTMVILPNPLMLIAGVIHIFLLQWEAWREEVYLTTVHGEEYVQYMQQTGRFFPRWNRIHGMNDATR
jgi:protein-S-isoprenylcysteine O-methyltransferase Ste14